MKKINILLAALAGAAAMISCQKEIEEVGNRAEQQNGTASEGGVVFRAVYDEMTTKTAISADGKVTWYSGDAISIFDGDGAAATWNTVDESLVYTKDKRYQTADDGETAVFKPSDESVVATEGKAKYYAMCPRNNGASCDVENGVFDFWLMDCQTAIKNGFSCERTMEGRHCNYSVAMTTDPENQPLVFHNALTQLKITVPEFLAGKVTHIAIIPLGGEYIAGDTEVTLAEDGTISDVSGRYAWKNSGLGSKYPAVYLFPDYNSDRYVISGATFEAGTYYAAIRSTSLSKGLLIEYRTTASGKASDATSVDAIATKRTGSSVTLQRSHLYDMGSIGDNPAKASAGVGVTSFPYSFSFYCTSQKDGDGKYINLGSLAETEYTMGDGAYSGNVYKQYSGVAATEKDETIGASLTLSSVTYYKKGSTEKTANKQFLYYAQNQAHDNLGSGDFCTLYGIAGLPFECGEYLSIPLQSDVPSAFSVSFGIFNQGSWGMKDWNVYYSNDNISWIKMGKTVSLTNIGTNGKYYMYFQATEDNCPVSLKKGGMLYVKIVPVGKASNSSASCDGFGLTNSGTGRYRFHSAITVSPATVEATTVESGATLFQAFDSFNGGLDYFIGDRLAGMANFCGAEGTLDGYTLSNVYQRPGYAQIGYVDSQTMANDGDMTTTNLIGSLTTPALGKSGDLALSFKACAYLSPAYRINANKGTDNQKIDGCAADLTTIRLNITGGGTIDGATTVDITDLPTGSWQTITKTIAGATADTKIEFTSPADGVFHRWFLDEVCVK